MFQVRYRSRQSPGLLGELTPYDSPRPLVSSHFHRSRWRPKERNGENEEDREKMKKERGSYQFYGFASSTLDDFDVALFEAIKREIYWTTLEICIPYE
jgi:hypothetical protein